MKTMTRRRRHRVDPRWADRQNQIGGQVLAMCCEAQKVLALARGWSEGWVSRLIAGHPAAGSYLRLVEDVQRFRATEAGPLAVAPLAEMCRIRAEAWSDVELVEAETSALELEGKREAVENAATLRWLLAQNEPRPAHEIHELERKLALALVHETAVQVVLLGILWEKERRRVIAGETCH